MHMRIILFLSTLLLAFPGAGPAEPKQQITVSAALSLKGAFEEIGALVRARHPGISVQFNFGASGALQRQIEGGAPVDVFASASPQETESLARKGLLVAGTLRSFASNAVVLVVPARGSVPIATFADLASEQVRRVAAGTPATVPAGRYADEVFRSLAIREALAPKLVYAENVRQVMDYVARNEADAGVVFATDVLSRTSDLRVAAVAPEGSHSPVLYQIAVVKDTKTEAASRTFLAAVLSEEGKRILRSHGFGPAP